MNNGMDSEVERVMFLFFWDKKEAKFSRLVGLVSAKQELLKLKYFIKTKESEEYR